jgi:ComF family protein
LTIAQILLRWVSLVVAPPSCCLCGGNGELLQGPEPGLAGRWHRIPLDLCEYCLAALPRPQSHWSSAGMAGAHCEQFAALQYRPPVDHLIRQFKFTGERSHGRVLATVLGRMRAGDRAQPLPQALVPVPMHARRFRERGLDHTLLLARWAAEVCAVPVLTDWLVRVKATPPQAGLSGAARRHNMQGAFAVRPAAKTARRGVPAHVALIDDVLTTGSTLAAASAALRTAGVGRIEHWVLARTVQLDDGLTENVVERNADKDHQPGVAVLEKRLEAALRFAPADQPLLAQETHAQRRDAQLEPKT